MQITPLNPNFVGEAAGIDISAPLSGDQVAEIESGMDRYPVLVFRDQKLTDEQQCGFSRNFGELEATLIGQMSKPGERRLGPVEMGDIANLDPTGKLRARDDNRRMYALGNRLWHSDASFRATGAGYSLLSARVVPGYGGNTSSIAAKICSVRSMRVRAGARTCSWISPASTCGKKSAPTFSDSSPATATTAHPINGVITRRRKMPANSHP
jgi:alpha-ketoglutarate-dependent 2,4-dichlorophenoxyacetate dioxygenase